MINPNTQYSGQVEAPDANYPYGGAKNETVPGLFDGTPFEKAMLADLWGLQQGLINTAGIVPSGNSDTVLVSDQMQALIHLVTAGAYFEDSGAADVYVLAPITNGFGPKAYNTGMRFRWVPDNTNTGASTVGISGLGAKTIKKEGTLTLDPGDLTAGQIVTIEYDGTDFQLVSATPIAATPIRDMSRGLVIKNNSGTPLSQMDIDADEVVLQAASGKALKFPSINETVDMTASGAGGLDTGSEAGSIWYYLWLIAKTDGTVDGLLSASSTAPTMPSGYVYKALVGAIYNDSGSDFISISQVGAKVSRTAATVVSGGASGSYASIDISAAVPATAKACSGTIGLVSSALDGQVLLASSSAGLGAVEFRFRSTGAGAGATQTPYIGLPVVESQVIYYFRVTVNANVAVSGWEY